MSHSTCTRYFEWPKIHSNRPTSFLTGAIVYYIRHTSESEEIYLCCPLLTRTSCVILVYTASLNLQGPYHSPRGSSTTLLPRTSVRPWSMFTHYISTQPALRR